ncbi:MAG TPA: SpoIIE family protein phosphatase, partial [Acidimicrobiia bacterium]|nr:SpoIIE family protein phosphatase [Acidimicrobiia bacterium]
MQPDVIQRALDSAGREILDVGWAAVIVTDAAGTVLVWNRRAEELYGWSADEALDRNIADLTVAPDDVETAAEIMAQLLAGEAWEGTFRVRRKDGSRVFVHVRDVPIVAEDGTVTAIVGMSVDATAPPLAGSALAQQARALEMTDARLARLQAITAALSGARTTDAVATVVLREVLPEVGAGSGGFWILDDSGESLSLLSQVGMREGVPARFASLPLSAPVPGAVAVTTGEAVLVTSVEHRDAEWPALRGTPTDMEAIAVVPLVVEGSAIGALAFGFPEARRFDDAEVAFLQAIADQSAIAIDRARLYDAERDLRDRLEFLAEATAILTERRDRWEVVRRLAELAAPRLADWCTVYAPVGRSLERVAIVGLDDAAVEVILRSTPVPIDSQSPIAEAYRTGASIDVPELTEEIIQRLTVAPEIVDLIRERGVRSGLAIPLVAHGEVFGVFVLAYGPSGRSCDGVLRALAEEVASRAALAVEQALIYEREHDVVLSLRRIVFPGQLPDVPGLEIDARYLPASEVVDIGGDWWDVFALPDGGVGVALGDVSGHGEAAAATMAQLRSALRAYAFDGRRPAEVLDRLSRFVELDGEFRFATVVYLDYDPHTGRTRWASAGHPPPVLATNGTWSFLEEPRQPALGILDTPYAEGGFDLPPGGRIVLYSDGLVEGRRRPVDQGLRELRETLESANDRDVSALVKAIEASLVPSVL